MASNISQAGQAWHYALKLRKHLLKQLEKLQAESASGIDISQFEAVDGLLEKFRLACVQTIFLDFKYAVTENTEDALWGLHISINAEHRRNLGRLKHSSHPVERRKAEKMYNNFLRIAQKFYKGYIQRLSARYDVQELRRVAQGIDVEQMDAEDTISPVPGSLSRMVLESCHSTLLHLGDLARYRIQARHKNSGFETALTYYGLARHLMPNSGFAFHQMGIVNLDQANHLDVVYHFYRAWAVETPHPNAKSNLESEFKSLRLPHAVKARNNPPAPADVFSTWFVKLHAFFYNGEAFSQQKELEEEVMHRLEMACRDASSSGTLLKMALVNMSAYDVASKTLTEEKTESASRFWQFTLRFNALFILTFCRALHSDLEEAVSNRTESSSDPKAVEISSTVGGLLPTLRIYCVWLAACREELLRPSNAFGATVPTMMYHIVKVFTLLCAVTYNQDNLASCPYLLAEDLEVRGNRSLTGDHIPKACRVSCDENGNAKPYLYDPQRSLDCEKENLARVLDVLRCAYFLAEDCSTPVSCQVVENWLVFEYQPDATPSTSQDNAKAVATSVEQASVKQVEKPAEHTPPQEARDLEELQVSKLNDMDVPEQQAETSSETDCQISEEDQAEKTVIAMLTPFLKPPTPQPQQHHVRSPDESSYYGMGHAPGIGMFGLMSYSSPTGSSFSGPIAPFPWAWDNTPKPDISQDAAYTAGKEAFNRVSRNNSPQEPTTARSSLEDPFATPGRGDALRGCAPVYPDPAKPGNPGSVPGPVAEPFHRGHLLQSFAGNGAPRTSSFGQWGETGGVSWPSKGMATSPWTSRALDQFPASSGISGFSHPSSLYMGTPADGVGLGVSGVSGQGDLGRNQLQSPTHGASASSPTRRMHVGNSASR
ncbi:est1 DNA/RNA binding domain-containing protein [Hirsutella rhossiliensis]|uniref:Nonsense-mediated mRNA decay factor n=1 Tax=Hirsutella rhossiliensis TaxID=111463 RepID=A0A9P8SIX5_9HYPO|nr:est1 DNA/RNA binding domain-containing protein [Hirsutella rhossiliensis]KAH0963065.1 est1 DNA/RNA binding domain-containing protein [Hirsutella rhossiliensis]